VDNLFLLENDTQELEDSFSEGEDYIEPLSEDSDLPRPKAPSPAKIPAPSPEKRKDPPKKSEEPSPKLH